MPGPAAARTLVVVVMMDSVVQGFGRPMGSIITPGRRDHLELRIQGLDRPSGSIVPPWPARACVMVVMASPVMEGW